MRRHARAAYVNWGGIAITAVALSLVGLTIAALEGAIDVRVAIAAGITLVGVPLGIRLGMWGLRRATYGEAILIAGAKAQPGETLQIMLDVKPHRRVTPRAVEWELVGHEVAISRGATSDTTYRHTFVAAHQETPAFNAWDADQVVRLQGEITVPLEVPGSFVDGDYTLSWAVRARAPVRGWPDLEVEHPITIDIPVVPVEPPGIPARYTATQGPFRGELEAEARVNPDGVLVIHPGGRLAGELAVEILSPLTARSADLRFLRVLSGSGARAEWVIGAHRLAEGDLQPGQRLSARFDWEIPNTPELSFEGRHVKVSWELEVKVDRPRTGDAHFRVPLLMRAAPTDLL